MKPEAFKHHDEIKRDTYTELKENYDGIKSEMSIIRSMEVSEKSKKPILEELQQKLNEIKERMHDCIDRLD